MRKVEFTHHLKFIQRYFNHLQKHVELQKSDSLDSFFLIFFFIQLHLDLRGFAQQPLLWASRHTHVECGGMHLSITITHTYTHTQGENNKASFEAKMLDGSVM